MQIEIRNDEVLIRGYVNSVERDSKKLQSPKGEFVEQVRSGTWQRAIEKNDNIKALLNHDENKELATTKDNLSLREDSIGLHAELRTENADVMKKARAGELVGWSFGFKKVKESWGKTDDGTERRYLDEVDLREVSILDNTRAPAYYGTLIEVRDDGETCIEQRFMRDVVEYIGVEGKNEEELKADLEKKIKLLELELEI